MAADDAMLRELAQHRGFKLVKSLRRKPGKGDYGRYGLADAKSGKQCFGFGKRGLTATAEEIEGYLRSEAAAAWKTSIAATRKPAAKKRVGARAVSRS
jgi:hypothetical protein